MLSGAGVQRSGTPEKSKHPYQKRVAIKEGVNQLHCTVCVTDAELPLMFEFPWYVTVTTVEPNGNDVVVNTAFPTLS